MQMHELKQSFLANCVAELSATTELCTLAEDTASVVLHHVGRPRDITREELTVVHNVSGNGKIVWG